MITAALVLAIFVLVMTLIALVLEAFDVCATNPFVGALTLAAIVALCVLAIIQFGVAQ